MGRHHKSVVISPYSPKSHGSNTHTRVSMSSIKDDQNVAFLFFQLGPRNSAPTTSVRGCQRSGARHRNPIRIRGNLLLIRRIGPRPRLD
jgi:hypothetical protein